MRGSIIQLLRDHPLFEGLPDSYLYLIADCSEEKVFNKSSYLFHYQQPAQKFFLMLEGQAVLLSHLPMGGLTTLETITAPNVAGWSWLIPPYRWHYSLKASQDTRCLVIHTESLKAKMEADKSFSVDMYQRFMVVVVGRLQASRLQTMDIYSNPSVVG